MDHLEKVPQGVPRCHFGALMIVPDNSDAVMERVELRYGRTEYVVQALVEIARKTLKDAK